MTVFYVIGGVVTVGLFAYLFAALLDVLRSHEARFFGSTQAIHGVRSLERPDGAIRTI